MQAKTTNYPAISNAYNGEIQAVSQFFVNGKGWKQYNRQVLTDREFKTILRLLRHGGASVVKLRIFEPVTGFSEPDFKITEILPVSEPTIGQGGQDIAALLNERPAMGTLSDYYWQQRLRYLNHAIKAIQELEHFTDKQTHIYPLNPETWGAYLSELKTEVEIIELYLKNA